jgi:hypothetical protein
MSPASPLNPLLAPPVKVKSVKPSKESNNSEWEMSASVLDPRDSMMAG